MTLDADIRSCLGDDAAHYAARKHQGGSNGSKGVRYEDFFIARKVVAAAVQLLDIPGADSPRIQAQLPGCFVDDVRIATATSTTYFQLKNTETVGWLAGSRPLEQDFRYQFTLSQYRQEPQPRTTLVVSKSALANSLANAVPSTIQPHTHVEHFPWTETANRLVLECPTLQAELATLTHVESAPHDVLCGTFGAVLMSCINHPGGASVTELLEHARNMFPSLLRLMPVTEDWEQHLRPEFRQVLDAIHGLRYGASRGFFHWVGFGTSGVFGSSVLSSAFQQFQSHIIQSQPKTFEAFEGALP